MNIWKFKERPTKCKTQHSTWNLVCTYMYSVTVMRSCQDFNLSLVKQFGMVIHAGLRYYPDGVKSKFCFSNERSCEWACSSQLLTTITISGSSLSFVICSFSYHFSSFLADFPSPTDHHAQRCWLLKLIVFCALDQVELATSKLVILITIIIKARANGAFCRWVFTALGGQFELIFELRRPC